MTSDIAKTIYLVFSMWITIRSRKENLNSSIIQAQLDETRHQLSLAIRKSQRGLHHEF